MSVEWGAGHVIMGRYRLVSILGSGGMGSVWKAEHLQLKTDVAVKLLDPAIAKDPQVVARFIREARSTAALRNRHVVQIFDYGVEDESAFIVMEMLQGETLGARIEKLGTLSVDDAIKFMCQVMRAIGRAHEIGIVHRDLKPENIFICADDEGEYAKVLDFGVAKVDSGALEHSAGVKTQTGMMIGTPFYMSPEQAKAKQVDHRADIWALAVITFEALTGKRPFNGQSFADLVINVCSMPIPLPSRIAAVPKGFDEWFVHGTQRDVEKRFKNTRDMANELMQLAQAPLVGRRSSVDDLALATVVGAPPPQVRGQAAAPAARPASAERARLGGSARPPGGGSVGARLDLTTGQRASTGYELRSEAAGGRTKWVALAVAAAALVGGAFAWRGARQADSAEQQAAAGVLEAQAAAIEAEPVTAPQPQVAVPALVIEEARPGEATKEEVPLPAVDAAEITKPAEAKAATKADAKADAKRAPGKDAEVPPVAPSTPSSEGGRVPVVDKASLPPKDWNF